eukprot:jgi/Mesen1/5639/ME000285S04919
MDFTKHVHLKKLTYLYVDSDFPEKYFDKCCVPVSPTGGYLKGLQEFHIRQMYVAHLPKWLAGLPAFTRFSCQIYADTSPLVLQSACPMTGLRELSITSYQLGAAEINTLATMSHLTALSLVYKEYAATDAAAAGPLLLSSTLQRLKVLGDIIPANRRLLPFLEDLSVNATEAIPPDYFAFTPDLRQLRLTLFRGVAWPRLECLAQLASLALDLNDGGHENEDDNDDDDEDEEEGTELKLHSCQLLRRVGGLFTLGRQVALSLCCTCQGGGGGDGRRNRGGDSSDEEGNRDEGGRGLWWHSYAEYAAAKFPCRRLPAGGDARQLVKDTRRPTLNHMLPPPPPPPSSSALVPPAPPPPPPATGTP